MSTGNITVTVQTEKRMAAITELAQAINKVADALRYSPEINITGNCISGVGPGKSGITVNSQSEAAEETTIYSMGDDKPST